MCKKGDKLKFFIRTKVFGFHRIVIISNLELEMK